MRLLQQTLQQLHVAAQPHAHPRPEAVRVRAVRQGLPPGTLPAQPSEDPRRRAQPLRLSVVLQELPHYARARPTPLQRGVRPGGWEGVFLFCLCVCVCGAWLWPS